MVLPLIIALILLILVANELWNRRYQPHSELSRKSVHIAVGSLVAFWPFWFSWQQIEWLSITFLVAIIISKQFGVFQAIHSVQRPTWGEFFFAIAVGGAALLTHDRWIYVAALLQMALADGLAAVLGVSYGNGQAYTIFRHQKSLVGTLTFFICSFSILLLCSHFGNLPGNLWQFLGISVSATVLENLGVAGLDNLLVPLAVTLLLRALA